MWVGPDAAPAGVPRKARTRAAPGLRPAATRGCPPGAGGRRPSTSRTTPQSAARLPEGERRDGAPRGARVLERERGTTEQWLRHLARHLPRIWRGTGRRAYPGPRQKTRVMALGCLTTESWRFPLSKGGGKARSCLTIESERLRNSLNIPLIPAKGRSSHP